MEQGL